MEIVFNSNKYLYRAVVVHNSLGSPDSVPRRLLEQGGQLAWDGLRTAGTIFELLNGKSSKDIWNALLDRNIARTLKEGKHGQLMAQLDKLDFDPPSAAETKEMEASISKYLNGNVKLEEYLEKMFGFALPPTVNIVIEAPLIHASRGGSNSPENFLISVSMNADDSIQSPVLHEILHVLMKGKVRFKSHNIEEAFLDLFTPAGLIEKEMGQIKEFDLDSKCRENKRHRPYASAESDTACAVLKEYLAKGNGTLREFLESEGRLDEFIV